jgi:hypothetical protein
MVKALPNGLLASSLPTIILYEFLVSPKRATCPVYKIIRCFITFIIFGEMHTTFCFGNLIYKDHMSDQQIYVMIILKLMSGHSDRRI